MLKARKPSRAKRIEEEKRRAKEIISRMELVEKLKKLGPKATLSIMNKTMEIAKSKKPIQVKAKEFAKNAWTIAIAFEEGIIKRETARKLVVALQKRAAESIQKETGFIAQKGIISQEMLALLEKMVEKKIVKRENATRIVSDYLGIAIENLKHAMQEKPIKSIPSELKRIKEILEREAELRGFSERIRKARLRQLKESVFEIIEAIVRKTKPRMDFYTIELIDQFVSQGMITKEQSFQLTAMFAETNLNAMIKGKTSTIGLGRLDPLIRGLPKEERSRLLKLRQILRQKILKERK